MKDYEEKELRAKIALQILDSPVPEETTWEQRIGFMVARIAFAKLVREGE